MHFQLKESVENKNIIGFFNFWSVYVTLFFALNITKCEFVLKNLIIYNTW